MKVGLHKNVVIFFSPANTIRWSNVDLILVHRLRRWPNESLLDQWFVLALEVLVKEDDNYSPNVGETELETENFGHVLSPYKIIGLFFQWS